MHIIYAKRNFPSVTVEESGYVKTNNYFWIDLNQLNTNNGDTFMLSNPYAKDLKGDITNNLKIDKNESLGHNPLPVLKEYIDTVSSPMSNSMLYFTVDLLSYLLK